MHPLRFALRHLTLGLVLAGALAAAQVPSASAEEVRLTLPQARKAAVQMLHRGQPKAALQLAQGVLLGAPDDPQALLIKARALQELGAHKAAKKSAKQAWSVSERAQDKYLAAMVQASTLAANGQNGVAQYWLRRAAQIAPEDAMRTAAVQDFRRLRRATPWRLSFGIKIEPSDNLNGAPKAESTDINGIVITPGARPVPGLRYGVTGQYSHRVALSENTRLKFGADLEITRAKLSSGASQRDPNATANRYREDSFGLSLDYEARDPNGRWIGTAGVKLHRNARRGEAFSNAAELHLFYGRMLSPTITASGRAELRREVLVQAKDLTVETREVGLALGKQFAPGRLRLDVWHSDTQSDLYMVANESAGAQLTFSKSRPIKGILPRFGLSYRDIDYDAAPFPFLSTDPRRDQEWVFSVDALLPKVDFYGFAPEIGLSYRDRRSNYGIYESESTDLRLGIKSVF